MSLALYNNIGGLRFLDEREIFLRDSWTQEIARVVSTKLLNANPAWKFHRVEGPLLTPREFINETYTDDDVWALKANLGESEAVLRPETTPSSYTYARHQMKSNKLAQPPVCFWQLGKSFRRETSDGANPAKMRYYEFYQLEFQCIYKADSKADYRNYVMEPLCNLISYLTACEARIVESDRLPAYSLSTMDIEAKVGRRWIEMCSMSIRKDFHPDMLVFEVAVGMDRLVAALLWTKN